MTDTGERPDRAALDERVRELNRMLAVHAGGITLEEVDDDGAVTVRFTGMCTGCQFRPVTLLTTVEPGLSQVPGVTSVHARGSRVSTEAAERLRDALRADEDGRMLVELVGRGAR